MYENQFLRTFYTYIYRKNKICFYFFQFALFALVAVAFASPKPEPQAVAYTVGGFPAAAYPYAYSGGVYAPYPAAASWPYAYNYFVRWNQL